MRAIAFLRLIPAAALVSLAASTATYAKKLAPASKPSPMLQKPLDDDKMSCKQLSGHIQVGILQIRDFSDRSQASGFSRSLQSAFSSTVGTSAKGIDPNGRNAAELKQLQDYNQRLVDKGCKSYDLEKELQVRDPAETPTATVPPPKKPKPAAQ